MELLVFFYNIYKDVKYNFRRKKEDMCLIFFLLKNVMIHFIFCGR